MPSNILNIFLSMLFARNFVLSEIDHIHNAAFELASMIVDE